MDGMETAAARVASVHPIVATEPFEGALLIVVRRTGFGPDARPFVCGYALFVDDPAPWSLDVRRPALATLPIVHGGVTYDAWHDGVRAIGFDTDHWPDQGDDARSPAWALVQCRRMARGLRALTPSAAQAVA